MCSSDLTVFVYLETFPEWQQHPDLQTTNWVTRGVYLHPTRWGWMVNFPDLQQTFELTHEWTQVYGSQLLPLRKVITEATIAYYSKKRKRRDQVAPQEPPDQPNPEVPLHHLVPPPKPTPQLLLDLFGDLQHNSNTSTYLGIASWNPNGFSDGHSEVIAWLQIGRAHV